MAGPLLYDRVLETTTTTGTGTLTLAGAVTGHQSFAAVGNGNTCPFCVYAVDGDGNPSGDWEVSIGTYTSSGTTLSRTTVLASSNGGSAVNFGAGTKRVALVLPASFLTQYAHPTNTFANLAAAQAGRILLPSNGFSLYRDTGSILVPWGPLFPLTAPVNGDFSWVNQGSAAVATTYGGVLISEAIDSGNSQQYRLRVKSAPSTPYTVDMLFLGVSFQNTTSTIAGVWRQSSDGKLILVSSDGAGVIKWNDPNNVSASYILGSSRTVPQASYCFIRLQDDGTDRKVYLSLDGQHWHLKHSVGRTDFLTADQVGFALNVGNQGFLTSSGLAGALLLHWKEG